ncbi:MAG TPA: oligoribonuclease [Candidatus Saccharimonadales bacterium]|nr:oligoribonuclease [Candidatus Saccharimonadales bacterium]
MSPKFAIPTKLLWIDLEMTGLDPSRDVILEIAAVITDFSFRSLTQYERTIRHSDAVLERANAWSKQQHTSSGLIERLRSEGKPQADVQTELATLISHHFAGEPAILAGNSIHSDRSFIKHWWPDVEKLLHYRMLDVSSLKVYMQGRYGVIFEKKEAHRAFDDIQESIAEWQYYMTWLQNPKNREPHQ